MKTTTPFYLSRTFWVNAAALVSLVIPSVQTWLADNPIDFVAALSALNVLLKFISFGKHEIADDTDEPDSHQSNTPSGSGLSVLLFFLIASPMVIMLASCGHDVTITPDRTEVSKNGSILIVDKVNATLSYRQAPVQTAQPTIINLPALK